MSRIGIRSTVAGIGILAWLGAALAQNAPTAIGLDNPIKSRQHLMESNGAASKIGGAILKGEEPFNPATTQMIFRSINDVAYAFGHYFPEGSQEGETRAAPAIWEQPEEFRAALEKLEADSRAALEADVQDQASFEQAFTRVTENCKSCHEQFRLPED